MGNIIKKMSCAIYPENIIDSDSDSEYEGLLPSEIIKKEYIKNEKNGICNNNLNLKPSQIIQIEKEKIKNLQI